MFAPFPRQLGKLAELRTDSSTPDFNTPSPKIAMPADDGQQEAALALESSRPAAPMAESMPSIAAPRVFGITELLENVLINLPFEDLFVLQRVDKHFNSTIAGSKALRTIMHLELQDISDGHIERCIYRWSSPCDELERILERRGALRTALLGMGHQHFGAGLLCFPQELSVRHIFMRMGSEGDIISSTASWKRMRAGRRGCTTAALLEHRCGYVVQDIKLGENATLGDILESFQKRERNGKVQCRKRPGEWHPATSKSNEQMHADEARPAPSLINSAKLVCEWPSLVMVGLLCLAYGVWQRHA